MPKCLAPTILVALAVLVCVVPARAQRGGGLVFAPIGRPAPPGLRGAVNSVRAHRSHRHVFASGYAPYFYSDSEPDTVEVSPQVIPAPPAPVAAQPVKPGESVLLELRGDRWVRVTNYGASESGESTAATQGGPAPTSAAIAARPDASPPSSTVLPRAALVFRDGHAEEIPKYVIVGRTLYTTADYWTTGSWTRKVEIAELDVPATLKLNQARGTKFSLPSGPIEVMMRP